MLRDFHFESLEKGFSICVTKAHTFGTDALLLADFAAPRPRDLACDLGSGCGIVPFFWMRPPGPGPLLAYALELSPLAVEQMRATLEKNPGIAGRVRPLQGDLRDLRPLSQALPPGRFDLASCNPPYEKAGCGRLSRDPLKRAARHEESCTLAQVCLAARRLLRPGGRFCLCQKPRRLVDAVCAMREAGLEPKRLRLVQRRPDAKPWLFLLEGVRDAGVCLEILPPFLMQSRDGGDSPELLGVYGSCFPQKSHKKDPGSA